jgi:hypothetical protein
VIAGGAVVAKGARALALVPGVALLLAIGYAGKRAEGFLRGYGKAHHSSRSSW